ncbi:LysE family transporter [Lutimaribacter sp. EGI FJ00015]|uniref:LysE family transporter n=1 Tax=Lutimaribacter degradans TaxID=2945989 RepID=A0ACC5ZS44_9RHOB|nr:LysE family transporter [Lutimaribacter sp. EGI FJ00013]MCM2561127.1 LysE family transporter [Lutimaribacter sp. EGI FJ00013]MCO0611924.1 LysE family transporter [Lutimaribacter sp. EGI FJ00015]MCO0634955.1 LysE family transporter [Lutimaribacter sp. EGI FJ00014]
MDWPHLIAFNIAILGALASPGPAFIAMMRTSFAHGRHAALRCGLGLACAAVCWTLLALAGLSAIFALVPWAYMALKLLGGAYLLWLAVVLWRGAHRPIDQDAPRGLGGFRLGLVTNFANPKAVFFIAAIFTTVFPTMPAGAEAALIVGNHLVLETVWYGAVAMILSTAPARAFYFRLKARIDRIAAAVLGVLALRVAS